MGKGDPLAKGAKKRRVRLFMALFFSFFFLIGMGTFIPFFVLPVFKVFDARDWQETPCVVLSSAVKGHSGSKGGSTFSVEIKFAYEFGGKRYTSDRYSFMSGSSSGRKGKVEVVSRYPPGKAAVCYVNPGNPAEAVIERGFVLDMLFGLIPLVFVVVGAVGLIFVIRHGRRRPAPAEAADWHRDVFGKDSPRVSVGSGPVVLKSSSSPLKGLIGLLFFGVFWNGIVSIFVWQAIKSWRDGKPEYFLTLFMIPFVLVGIGVFVGVGYYFLKLFNPRVKLVVSSGAVPLGGSAEVAWVLFGRTGRLQRLRIFLEGRESARYQRGTSTYTDTETFAEIDLVDLADQRDMASGKAVLTVPDDTMHTFKSANNKILWHLKVAGEIPMWPDVSEEFEVTVLPSGAVGVDLL